MEDNSFRNRASFGKRIEHYLIGKMLKEGLDLYLPMVDDDAIDVVVKRPDGKYVEVQIKARSKNVEQGAAALFAAIEHRLRELLVCLLLRKDGYDVDNVFQRIYQGNIPKQKWKKYRKTQDTF